jgi:hypothetical protein
VCNTNHSCYATLKTSYACNCERFVVNAIAPIADYSLPEIVFCVANIINYVFQKCRHTVTEVKEACFEVLKSHLELSAVFSFDKSGRILKNIRPLPNISCILKLIVHKKKFLPKSMEILFRACCSGICE